MLKSVTTKQGFGFLLCRNRFLSSNSSLLSKKVAVVFSGCGVYDGTEIHEASSTLIHLSRAKADVKIFAPNKSQIHCIDHSKGEPMNSNRNVLIESARIARGKIAPLSDLKASQFDAIIFPGGFGAAKNLSNFAEKNVDCSLDSQVERVLKEFHSANKPIGLMCIAPVLAARAFPGVEVTLGGEDNQGGKWPFADATQAVKKMGAKHISRDVLEVHVDKKHKIVTTPAFMCDTGFHNIFDGIGELVKILLKMA